MVTTPPPERGSLTVAVQEAARFDRRAVSVQSGLLAATPVVTVLADSALHASELDESKALEARERARAALADRPEGVDLTAAQAALVEAEARYRASQQLKGHSG